MPAGLLSSQRNGEAWLAKQCNRHPKGTKKQMQPVKLYRYFLTGYLLASFALLFISYKIGKSPMLIVSDGRNYYAWVRSVFLDSDINFENDYELLYPPDPLPVEFNQQTPNGYIVNKYPIGLGILEIPGFMIGHIFANLFSIPTDGISFPYQFGVTYSLVLFYVWSFYLLYGAMKNFGVNKSWACFLCAVMLIGTNLIHYIT